MMSFRHLNLLGFVFISLFSTSNALAGGMPVIHHFSGVFRASDYSRTMNLGQPVLVRIAVTNSGSANATNVSVELDFSGTQRTYYSGTLPPNRSHFYEFKPFNTTASMLDAANLIHYSYVVFYTDQSGDNMRIPVTGRIEETFRPTLLGPYSGGTGILSNPYLLSSAEDIVTLSTLPSDWASGVFLRMTRNIQFNASNLASLDKIGNDIVSFDAHFDGNFKGLTGFSKSYSDGASRGFFGVVGSTGVISNVHILSGDVVLTSGGSGGTMGGLVGTNFGLVVDSSVDVDVMGNGGPSQQFGGLVGRNETTGIIRQSRFLGNITNGCNNTGGITGLNLGIIENSYVQGTISIDPGVCVNVGGIAGDGFRGKGS